MKKRISRDDLRRYQEIFTVMESCFTEFPIDVVGVEVFTPNRGQASGRRKNSGSGKTLVIYGAAIVLATIRGLPVSVSIAGDQQRFFLKRRKGDKEEVQQALNTLHPEIGKAIEEYPKTYREHLADASAHAIIAAERFLAGELD